MAALMPLSTIAETTHLFVLIPYVAFADTLLVWHRDNLDIMLPHIRSQGVNTNMQQLSWGSIMSGTLNKLGCGDLEQAALK